MDNAEVLKEYGKYVDTDRPATGGNVAYDLSRFDNRRNVREAVLEAPEERRVSREHAAAPREKLSLGVILMYALIAGLAALLISNYMTLTIMTDDLTTLAGTLEDLKNEEVILQKQYDQRYILNDIETYAVNNLGMVKLESNMMEYIELSNPDNITMIDPYEESKVSGFFNSIVERIKEFLEFLA